jgi:hypothetical protein
LVFAGRHWVFLTIAILAVVFVRPSPEAWTWIGAAAILAVLGLLWFALSRARLKSTDEVANLDLGLSPQVSSRPGTSSIALSPPKVPDRWRALVDSRSPRDVYMWARVWTSFLGETISVIVIICANFAGAHSHHESPIQFVFSHPDVGSLAILLPYFASVGARIKGFLTTRDIMRDGEVTIAYTINQSGSRATYQFWTKTGAVFERRTRVIKRPEFSAGLGLVPVFYMPEDPRKSVALYGTEFSIRLPQEDSARQLEKAPSSI